MDPKRNDVLIDITGHNLGIEALPQIRLNNDENIPEVLYSRHFDVKLTSEEKLSQGLPREVFPIGMPSDRIGYGPF